MTNADLDSVELNSLKKDFIDLNNDYTDVYNLINLYYFYSKILKFFHRFSLNLGT